MGKMGTVRRKCIKKLLRIWNRNKRFRGNKVNLFSKPVKIYIFFLKNEFNVKFKTKKNL